MSHTKWTVIDATTKRTLRSNAGCGGWNRLLLAACLAVSGAGALADGPYFSFEPSVCWEDNVTNAPAGEGVLGDFAAGALGNASWVTAPDFSTTLTCGIAAAGQVWARYDGLDNLSAGPRAEIRRKFGLGPYAPVVAFGIEADGVLFNDFERSGLQGALDLDFTLRFTEALQAEFGAKMGGADARREIFSGDYARLDAALNWDVDETWRIKLLGGWREGGVVTDYRAAYFNGKWVTADSYAAGTPETYPAGYLPGQYGPWRYVTTFNEPFLAFRVHGRTWNYGLGVSPALGPRTSFILQFMRFQTTMSANQYTNDLVSAGVVRHF